MEARFEAVYEIVRENQPTGIRFTYYTATTRGIVEKTQSGYEKIQRAVLHLRRTGRIPWSWIVDTNRWMRKPTTYGSIDELLDTAAASYRRDLWRTSKVAVEVWCESESIAGVLYPVTSKWDVPLYPIKGQTSDSFAYGAGEQYRRDPRSVVVYYVGDHDPHGYEIESNLKAKLIEFSGRSIAWCRLAVDADDVARLSLPGTEPKKPSYRDALTGERVPWRGPSVEIEAVPPPTLRQWLDATIEQHVDPEALRLTRIAEESEREILLAMKGHTA
ncbi:hypothetical protein [Micromonospora sp. NPDC126480]|uniref:hypothetical protein n=1 Tax=Micromonospora sp. NPDC126480 TaxID=3155312 RepID=UPI003333BA4D